MANKLILSEEHLKVLEEVINENVLYCTDEELFFLFEDALKKKNINTICYTTYRNYKNNNEEYKAKFPDNAYLFEKLLSLIKKSLLKEKTNCFNSMKHDGQWQRWAWIIERKFSDWNLKNISEVKSEVTNTNINIVVENEKAKDQFDKLSNL